MLIYFSFDQNEDFLTIVSILKWLCSLDSVENICRQNYFVIKSIFEQKIEMLIYSKIASLNEKMYPLTFFDWICLLESVEKTSKYPQKLLCYLNKLFEERKEMLIFSKIAL